MPRNCPALKGRDDSLEASDATGHGGHRLSSEELGLLAKKLAAAKDPKEAARLRQRIARGFYGI